MCGIVGHYGEEQSHRILLSSLKNLFHRGHDSAAIFVVDGENLGAIKDINLRDFDESKLEKMKGNIGVAHNRYTTTGSYKNQKEGQPFVFKEGNAFCIFAHNGNLTNTEEVKTYLEDKEYDIVSDSDSELLGRVFFDGYLNAQGSQMEKVSKASLLVHEKCKGAYSVVSYIKGVGLIGFRDVFGIRPLVITKKENDWVIASEDVASSDIGFKLHSDVFPGEVVIINEKGLSRQAYSEDIRHMPCAFEYIYLAREESNINGVSVKDMRKSLGRSLGEHIREEHNLDIDCVVPIPGSACTASFELSKALGVPYEEGLKKIKNSLRSFMLPKNRIEEVKRKFEVNEEVFKGKKVLLVDDSIVRGNTIKGIIHLIKNKGAKEVYFAVYSPKIKYQNFYGISIRTRSELVANKYDSEKELADHFGVNGIIYLPIENFKEALISKGNGIKDFELSCFTGEYIEYPYETAVPAENLEWSGEIVAA